MLLFFTGLLKAMSYDSVDTAKHLPELSVHLFVILSGHIQALSCISLTDKIQLTLGNFNFS